MVRIEEGKIIIEIHTSTPCEDFEMLNKALAECIVGCLASGQFVNEAVSEVVDFMKAMHPTYEQIKKAHGLQK